jgi:hypothetical protein
MSGVFWVVIVSLGPGSEIFSLYWRFVDTTSNMSLDEIVGGRG